jgi:hypothetical protein
MTQMDKFEDMNGRFVSLGTVMTQRHKFRDRRWTLLLYFIVYLFDVINFYVSFYNFGQTLRWFDSPNFLE